MADDGTRGKLLTAFFKTQNRVRYTNVQAKNAAHTRSLNNSHWCLEKERRQSVTLMDKEQKEWKNRLKDMCIERRRHSVADMAFKLDQINSAVGFEDEIDPDETPPQTPPTIHAPTAPPTIPEPSSSTSATYTAVPSVISPPTGPQPILTVGDAIETVYQLNQQENSSRNLSNSNESGLTGANPFQFSSLMAYKNYGHKGTKTLNGFPDSIKTKSSTLNQLNNLSASLPQVSTDPKQSRTLLKNGLSYGYNSYGGTSQQPITPFGTDDSVYNSFTRASTPYRSPTPGRYDRRSSTSLTAPNLNSLSLVRFQGLGAPEAIGSVRRRRKTIEEQARDSMRYRLAASAAPLRRRASMGVINASGNASFSAGNLNKSNNFSRPLLPRRNSHQHCTHNSSYH